MLFRVTTITFLATPLVAAGIAVIGCSGKAASVRQEKARALAAAAPRPTVASIAKAPQHFAKPAPRDYAFASYSDPQNGVSIRYPRNFALLQFDDDDSESDRIISWQQAKEAGAGVRTADELNEVEPGATLLATIVVPEDAYPNTSFAGGSIQFAVNRYQTSASCRANLLARPGDAKAPSGDVKAQGVSFAWIDIDSGDGNTEFYERDYAGFANDACYEFFVRVGVASTESQGTPENVSTATGAASPVNAENSTTYRAPNQRKIVAQLEKIIASVQVEPKEVSALDRPKYKVPLVSPTSD